MPYGSTDDGKNNEVIDCQARYGADSVGGAGLVLGIDATEGNAAITGSIDTLFLGSVAPGGGVGAMNFKTAAMAAETTFAEAGFNYGGVLDKRYALDAPVTVPIGSVALVTATVTGA